eukprot:CAMPEP_0197657380 /NCGR_PEP_ID=MMETSP1338-20131121/44587_1 /TAXON_ID=43686 ORGANISM="Pelagodinium beii, Strain RCC1491" /NCGR_SAMPLE_ID=MMETSP1338 /ASSEMBLY_ACC=CAM_ASM_000754 /LENGTH=343 /DNA_ID=CAMNT_0043233727 /DNA_START=426 /DNA_END=1457 /DNA_ORIENTATION=+
MSSQRIETEIQAGHEVDVWGGQKSSNEHASSSKPYYDLMVIVPAASSEQSRRNAIRRNWDEYVDSNGICKKCGSNRTSKLLFLVPQADDEEMRKEIAEKTDIAVLAGLTKEMDFYRNLTAKVKNSIRYVVRNFRFALLLKVDTDSYIFLDRLLNLAEKSDMFRSADDTRPGIYAGKFFLDAQPVEVEGSRWRDTEYRRLTGMHTFPTYACGAGYMMSPSLAKYISHQQDAMEMALKQNRNDDEDDDHWTSMPQLQDLVNEDVSVGFWLQPIVHHKVHLPVAPFALGCTDKSQVIDHHVKEKLFDLRAKAIHANGDPCSGDDVARESDLEAREGLEVDRQSTHR